MLDRDITAVVPALNEEKTLPATLARLKECGLEIIVVDGGSTDRTVEMARLAADRVLESAPGRARQMNLGAAAAKGDILFFVHADSLPPIGAADLVRRTLAKPGIVAGAFLLRLETRRPLLRLVNALIDLRTRLMRIPYGDQGIFLKKETFFRIGGYKDWPLMEDVDLIRRLKRIGHIGLAPGRLRTSARRYEETGVILATLRNQRRLWRFRRGTPPHRLAQDYPDVR